MDFLVRKFVCMEITTSMKGVIDPTMVSPLEKIIIIRTATKIKVPPTTMSQKQSKNQ